VAAISIVGCNVMYGDWVLRKYFAVLDILTLLEFRYDDHVSRVVCLE
jgi:hypothetical protein